MSTGLTGLVVHSPAWSTMSAGMPASMMGAPAPTALQPNYTMPGGGASGPSGGGGIATAHLQQFQASAHQQRTHARDQAEQHPHALTHAPHHQPQSAMTGAAGNNRPHHTTASTTTPPQHSNPWLKAEPVAPAPASSSSASTFSPRLSSHATPTKSPAGQFAARSPASAPASPGLVLPSPPAAAASTPSPVRRPVKVYRNEEVLLFRTPGDASHLILFNLPSKPFIHACYDLRTVAKARKDADDAMRRERGEIIPDLAAATATSATGTVDAAAVGPTPNASVGAPPKAAPPKPSSITTASVALAAAASSPLALAAAYHAMHLQNIERVLHSLAIRYGLVHEMSVHCKARDLTTKVHRRRGPYEDEFEEARSPIEAYEAGFNLYAYIKYYSVLHAGVAVKELNRTVLGPGQRLKAKIYERPPKPKPAPAVSTTDASGAPSASAAAPAVEEPRPYFPLAQNRCLDVCNYFLGFNNWNCEIKEIRPFDQARDEELMDGQQRDCSSYRASVAAKFAHSWTATVLVDMAGQQFVCSGCGHSDRREEATRAKKKAVTNAYRQLFASLALVVLHNGKVAVQILP